MAGRKRGRSRVRRRAAVLAAMALAGVGGVGAYWASRVPPTRAEPLSMKLVTGPAVACNFRGWSNDQDPAGLPVRVNPDPSSPSLARLPPPKTIGVDEFAVIVTVTGYKDGWFRISEAAFPDEAYPQGGNTGRPVFSGSGWVPAPMVKATLGSDVLRTAPRADAPRKAALSGTRGGFPITPDVVGVKRLMSCQGNWVEAETEFGPGWVAKACARQLSACR